MQALSNHQTLRGLFQRDDIIIRAADPLSHNGYQAWHRAYSAGLTRWLADNPRAGVSEFYHELVRIFGQEEMLQRFPYGLSDVQRFFQGKFPGIK